jgi:hypothetical protein
VLSPQAFSAALPGANNRGSETFPDRDHSITRARSHTGVILWVTGEVRIIALIIVVWSVCNLAEADYERSVLVFEDLAGKNLGRIELYLLELLASHRDRVLVDVANTVGVILHLHLK